MDEVRWLDEAERRGWLALVGVVLRLPATLDAPLQRQSGLTHFDYLVLVVLSEAEQRTLSMSQLAARSSSSLSRLSHVVAKLSARGWITRRPSRQDGRTTLAELTPAGLAALTAAAPGHVATVRESVIDVLDAEEIAQLAVIGEKILARLQREG